MRVFKTIRIVGLGLIWLMISPWAVMGTEPKPNTDVADWFYEVRIGILAHDVDNLWSGTSVEDGIDLNAELIFARPGIAVFSGNIRPNIGVSVNSQGATSKLYAGILWEIEGRTGLFFDIGLGLALHNGELQTENPDRKQLGSRVLFRVPIEFGYALSEHHRIAVSFDHISNAYLANPNEGMDTLGVRYCYRF
jgi:hypothetical protein